MLKQRFKVITAVHLFLFQNNNILLLRRYNTGYEDGNYSVIAGHLEGDEEVKQAAIREALEEGGIYIAEEDLDIVGVMHRKSSDERIDFFVVARKWSGELTNMEPEKCDDLSWYPLAELPANMIPYVEQAIHNYRKGIWFDSYGWK